MTTETPPDTPGQSSTPGKAGDLETQVTDAAGTWWHQLSPGDRAELRRCRTPQQVQWLPQYYHLRRGLPLGARTWTTLPSLAGLSAHLREAPVGAGLRWAFPQQLGERSGDSRKLNENRFRRILSEDDLGDLYPQLVRCLRLLDGRVHLTSLWLGLRSWNDRTKRHWAEAYYDSSTS